MSAEYESLEQEGNAAAKSKVPLPPPPPPDEKNAADVGGTNGMEMKNKVEEKSAKPEEIGEKKMTASEATEKTNNNTKSQIATKTTQDATNTERSAEPSTEGKKKKKKKKRKKRKVPHFKKRGNPILKTISLVSAMLSILLFAGFMIFMMLAVMDPVKKKATSN